MRGGDGSWLLYTVQNARKKCFVHELHGVPAAGSRSCHTSCSIVGALVQAWPPGPRGARAKGHRVIPDVSGLNGTSHRCIEYTCRPVTPRTVGMPIQIELILPLLIPIPKPTFYPCCQVPTSTTLPGVFSPPGEGEITSTTVGTYLLPDVDFFNLPPRVKKTRY